MLKVKLEFNEALEKIYWNVFVEELVGFNLLFYCFVNLLLFIINSIFYMLFVFIFYFFNSRFPPLRGIFAFHYICLFLRLSVDPFIFAKYLFGVPYEINSSLLIATTKREHSFLNKVKEEFNAPEKTYWNVCPAKLVMPTMLALIYCFIVV